MHLIVIIAVGIFSGLWMFVRWVEWREARIERAAYKRGMEMLYPSVQPAPNTAHPSGGGFGTGLMVFFFLVVGLITVLAAIG